MNKNKRIKRITAGLLCGATALGMIGCSSTSSLPQVQTTSGTEPYTQETTVSEEEALEISETFTHRTTDFAFSLLSSVVNSKDGDSNILISPASVSIALSMAANGARSDTQKQMLSLFQTETEEISYLNQFWKQYTENTSGNSSPMNIANSVWYRNINALRVEDAFLQTNQNYYQAEITAAPFDASTVDEINQWVNTHTEGMIPKIIEELTDDSMLCLINAIVFEGEWEDPYTEENLEEGIFTREDQSESTVTYMNSMEGSYLSNEFCTGTVRYYKNGYEMLLLLPTEGTTTQSLIENLNATSYYELLANRKRADVVTQLPKFSMDDGYNLVDILSSLGMEDAFSPENADLSGMGTVEAMNLYISDVIHKTHIEVDEKGTKAAAVTEIGIKANAAAADEIPLCYVLCNRPFVYIIADSHTHMPVFTGVINQL